jgi:hypothetical protein
MKTCYIYSFLNPLDENIIDDKDTHPLGVVPVHLKDGRVLEAALLGTDNTVKGFRLSIPNVVEDQIDPEAIGDFLICEDLCSIAFARYTIQAQSSLGEEMAYSPCGISWRLRKGRLSLSRSPSHLTRTTASISMV